MTNTDNRYEEYIELLKANKNLILTGAPGTGKTYLAKKIAEIMEADYEFVQFHPSYDYTDFVEGLRPTSPDGNGNIGFERKDGVFKRFCKNAFESASIVKSVNVRPERKIVNDVQNDKSSLFEDVYSSIVDDIKCGKIKTTNWNNRSRFNVEIKNGRIYYEDRFEKEYNIKRMFNYCIRKGIYDVGDWERDDFWNLVDKVTDGRTKTVDYTRYGWILQELLTRAKKLNQTQSNLVNPLLGNDHKYVHPDIIQPVSVSEAEDKKDILAHANNYIHKEHVFIIDEINRGELSKIFGELFFSIDPGYRGKKGLVKTQYQNLITDKSDPFYDGFYVPENVYIIGTMNDIDRSVESMDFAMRRRFAWKEVRADENTGMLDDLGSMKLDVVAKMNRLNEAIWNDATNDGIEGLSRAYHIGGAYFRKLKLYLNDDFSNKDEAYRILWDNHLRGVLFEYLRGSIDAAENMKMLENVYFSE